MPATPLLVARRPQTSFIPVRTDKRTYYIDPDNPPMPDRDLGWWDENTLRGKYVGRGFTVGGIVGLVLLCLAVIMGFAFAYMCFCYRKRTHRKPKGGFKAVPGGSSGTRSMGDLEDEDYMNTPTPAKSKEKKGGPFSGFSVPKLPKIFNRGGAKADKSQESEKLVGGSGVGGSGGGAKEHYRKLNLPNLLGTPRHDEVMIGSSPPHTPSAAFGWNSVSTVAASREGHRGSVTDTGYRGAAGSDTSDTSIYAPPRYTPTPTTASSNASGNGNGNNNNGAGGDESRRNSHRISGNWDEMYQTKPAPYLFDDDDKELYSRRGY